MFGYSLFVARCSVFSHVYAQSGKHIIIADQKFTVMKKIYLFIVYVFLIQAFVKPQSCAPDGIFFATQEEIDSFQVNHPNCTEIEGFVIIHGDNITNLNGLNVLTSIDGYISFENTSLASLTGLESLISIGGDLRIGMNFVGWGQPNPNLTDISALANLTFIGGDLRIGFNELLSTCEIQSICDYLASPNGIIEITENAPGCNSLQEVEDACEAVNVNEISLTDEFSIHPNPATNELFIESKSETMIEEINIYNSVGQIVITEKRLSNRIDVSSLKQGIYIIELTADKWSMRQKLVVK